MAIEIPGNGLLNRHHHPTRSPQSPVRLSSTLFTAKSVIHWFSSKASPGPRRRNHFFEPMDQDKDYAFNWIEKHQGWMEVWNMNQIVIGYRVGLEPCIFLLYDSRTCTVPDMFFDAKSAYVKRGFCMTFSKSNSRFSGSSTTFNLVKSSNQEKTHTHKFLT